MSSAEHNWTILRTALSLAEPEICIPNLRQVMERMGCRAAPAEFFEAVTSAYRRAQQVCLPSSAAPAFREGASHHAFVAGLEQAARYHEGPAHILALGCGHDFAGAGADYAAQVIREVIPAEKVRTLELMNLTRTDLQSPVLSSGKRRYDLVVSHSLLHFIPELSAALKHIAALLPSNGLYLMAHEPNARFRSNQQVLEERQRMLAERAARRRRMQLLNARAYWVKLRIFLGGEPPRSIDTMVNQYLAQRDGLHADLSANEIARIVDPHKPSDGADNFRIGLNGLDAESLCGPGFGDKTLIWSRSYDHLGYLDYNPLPQKWKQRNRELARAYPLDGAVWTALWRGK